MWEHYEEAVEEEFIGWEKEVRVIDEVREGCIIKRFGVHRWKKKVLAAAEKGIGRKKMVERSEGWWSDEVERLIDARKVACRKLRGARRRGERYTEATLGQSQKSEKRDEEENLKGEEGIGKENSKEDQRAGWHELQTVFWTDLMGKRKE